jgi:hypothetical protein
MIFQRFAENPKIHLQRDPREPFLLQRCALPLHKTPWKDCNHCIHTLAGARANSGGRRRGGGVRVSARGAPAGPPGAIGVPGPAGGAAGGPLGDAQGKAAAWAQTAGNGGQIAKQWGPGSTPGGWRKGEERLHGTGLAWEASLAAARHSTAVAQKTGRRSACLC